MDFHSLSRKELQTLCKKNKIPANVTNVAMADALSALPQVEGLDEFFNPTEAEAGPGTRTPETHRTSNRPSTRRKALKEEPQSSKVVSSQRPQRGTRRGNGEGGVSEEENKDANVLLTPAARRRAPAATSRRKKEAEMVEDDEKNEKNEGNGKPTNVSKTPAAVPSSRKTATGRSVCSKTEGTSVQQAYNTRRSVRFLEKKLSKMSLMEAEDTGLSKIDDVSEEVSSVSQQIEDSADTNEEGASLEVVSSVVSEETDELEVSSLDKKTEHEFQFDDSSLEVQFVSGTENDVGAGLEDEPQEEDLGKVDCWVADSEPHESNLKSEDSSETPEDSNEVRECYDGSIVDTNKSIGENVHEQIEAGSELLSELEDSCDSAEAEYKDCLGTKQEAFSVEASENASVEFTEQDVAAVTIEVPDDASVEVTEQDVAALSVEASEDASKEFTEQDVAVEASEGASMELTEKDVAALAVEVPDDASVEVTDQDVAGLLALSSVSDSSARPKELLDHTDNHGSYEVDGNQYIQHFEPVNHVDAAEADEKNFSNICSCGEHQEEGSEVESENTEGFLAEEMDHHSDVIGASSPIASEKVDANVSSENSIDDVEVCIDSSAEESTNGKNVTLESPLLHEHQEELEAKSEDLEESMEDVEKTVDGASDVVVGVSSATTSLEKDANASSENSIAAAAENSTESLADVNVDTLESFLVEVDVQEAAEETAFDATSAFPCGLDQTSNPQIPSQVSAEYDEISDSCSSDVSVLSINPNTLVEVDVISEEVVIPRQESHVSAETTVTVEPIPELKASHITMQSAVAEQSDGESKGVSCETQAVPKMIGVENNMHSAANMKENLTIDELQRKSLRELKKMMKKLTLVDDKPNCKSNKTCDNVVKEVERKRTALQALPGNQMTKGEALNDV